jgi:hypothetical protein
MLPRVAPRRASFRCTGDGASSCLESPILLLRRAQLMNLRVAPHLLFCDASESLMRPRVAPHNAPSGISDGEFAGCPAHSLPRLPLADGSASFLAQRSCLRRHRCVYGLRAGCPTACLVSCSYGWADVTPRLDSNLASPARPRMNLCFQPAPAHSPLALDAITIKPHTPQPAPAMEFRAQSDSAPSCQRGTAFPIPWRSPTEKELRPVKSVEASAKKE